MGPSANNLWIQQLPVMATAATAMTEKRRGSSGSTGSSSKKHGPDILLPEDYDPCEYTVIIGRGKKIRESTGNRRLRVLAASMLPQYEEAADTDDRAAKTRLVNTVVDLIERACRESGTDNSGHMIDVDDISNVAFVRQGKEDGRWYEVDDSVAREKVGYVFRDLLADRYESSSKSKVAKKMQLQRERKEQQEREERIMVNALLELTTTTNATIGGDTTVSERSNISDAPMTPVAPDGLRDGSSLENDLLNSPIIECLPME